MENKDFFDNFNQITEEDLKDYAHERLTPERMQAIRNWYRQVTKGQTIRDLLEENESNE